MCRNPRDVSRYKTLVAIEAGGIPVLFVKGIQTGLVSVFMHEFPVLNIACMELEGCAVKMNERTEP